MSIFTKPLSQLDTADLQELLTDKAVENVRLEFKLRVPDKDETLKKLSSFANTFGGFMVVGVEANSRDGRIENLPGVDVESGYKQKIVQWCFDGASPPITVEVSDPLPTPGGGGKVCYVIFVSESDVAPHFLNGRKGVWVRTDEFSSRFEARMANENELRLLFDRRKQIRERRTNLLERARKRFNTYAAQLHTDSMPIKMTAGSCLELCVVPRFPARPICDQARLGSLILKNLVNWRGTVFPRRNDVISQHESAIVLQATGGFSIFEANVWGMLFYGARIEGDEGGTVGIHLYQLVGFVLLFIAHADAMLRALGYSGPVVIESALASVLGVKWLYSPSGMGISARSGSELDDDVVFSITTTTEILREKRNHVVMDLLQYILFSVNLSNMADTQEKLEALVNWGYKFNSWA